MKRLWRLVKRVGSWLVGLIGETCGLFLRDLLP